MPDFHFLQNSLRRVTGGPVVGRARSLLPRALLRTGRGIRLSLPFRRSRLVRREALCILDVGGSWAGGEFARRGVACQGSAWYGQDLALE